MDHAAALAIYSYVAWRGCSPPAGQEQLPYLLVRSLEFPLAPLAIKLSIHPAAAAETNKNITKQAIMRACMVPADDAMNDKRGQLARRKQRCTTYLPAVATQDNQRECMNEMEPARPPQ
jgi:hypothetical protein